ncbi:MAG: penicillin-binding transpeptidase domain-containing protein, partial [Bacteroidales bacterium]
VGRVRSANYRALLQDPSKPLFDRTLMAYYPPGSIFKIPQALIALQEGVITENTAIPCDHSLVGCHNHPSATNVASALRMSCNPYFYVVFRRLIMQGKDLNRFKDSRLGLEEWESYMKSFGFGTRLAIDLPNAKAGMIPNVAFFDRYYGKERWAFSTIYSLSIGQGEVGLIPLQMANLAAIVANRGFYKTPHLVRYIGENKQIPNIDTEKHYTKIESPYFEPIIEGMYGAVHEPGGTARRARLDSIIVCGKTGTSQNPHGKDHAVFIAFAPKDKPKIAISVFIENSGFGGTWSAPIAGLLIEYYLTRQRPRPELEKQMMEASFTPKEERKKD